MRVLFHRAEDPPPATRARVLLHTSHIILRRREASHYTDAATPIRLWWAMPSWRRGNWEQQPCSSSPRQNMAHICTICNDLLSIVALRQSQALERLVIAARLGLRDDKGMQRGRPSQTLPELLLWSACAIVIFSIGPVLCHACREIRCLSSQMFVIHMIICHPLSFATCF